MAAAVHGAALDVLACASIEALVDASTMQPLSAPTRHSVAYIARHLGERVRLADLAAASGETPFRLIRAFRRDVGTTPHAFLVRARVAVAAALLTAGEPIASIATAVGFVDQAHLTRHFKRVQGRTPGSARLDSCIAVRPLGAQRPPHLQRQAARSTATSPSVAA